MYNSILEHLLSKREWGGGGGECVPFDYCKDRNCRPILKLDILKEAHISSNRGAKSSNKRLLREVTGLNAPPDKNMVSE